MNNNKLIELTQQAGAEIWSRAPMRAITGLAFTDENLIKLYDLIVKECVDAVDTADQSHGATSYDLMVIKATKERCIKNLKRNLGYVVN
jgi:hypothetical protein